MAVKFFQAREPAFQRPQLPLLLAQPHRMAAAVIVGFWSMGHGTARLFFLNPLEFQQMKKERVPSQRNLLQ